MKYLPLLARFVFCMLIASCKKDPAEGTSFLASVNVINAIAIDDAVQEMRVNFTGQDVYYAEVLPHTYWENDGRDNFNGAIAYGVPTGVDLPLKIAHYRDTSTLIYNNTVRFQPGDVYTLFMGGDINTVEPLLVKENFPKHSDSTTGVRFVNLCSNSPELSINLVGSPNGSEVAALPYKGITDFKNYSAKSDDEFYDFEIRNAATGEVLSFYTYFNLSRKGNITLVIRGIIDGPVPFEVVRVNNF